MPRTGKRNKRKAKKPGGGAGRRPLDLKKHKWWKDRLLASMEAKADFSTSAKEVDNYFRSAHDSLFNSPTTRSNFLDFRGAVAVSVPKSAQIRAAMAPQIYVSNPQRQVVPRGHDTVMLGLAKVLETYINRTPIESKLERQGRKQVDDGLLRGRGFMFTGWDDVLEIITSWAISSRDVLIDGSSYSLAEAEWIAIRRKVPLFRLKREIEDGWRKKNLKGTHTMGSSTETPEEYGDLDDREKEGVDHGPTNDMVEVWDIYSKMGSGVMGADFPGSEKRKDPGADQDFVKLSCVLSHDVLIFEGDWEVPLYLDREWPIEALDFVETLDQLWPESIMSQVMPLQKAMDLLTSLALISCRNRGRTILYGDKSEEKRVQELVKGGEACVYVGFEPDTKRTPMSHRFGVLDLGRQTPEISIERDFIASEFERTTGLTAAVTGGEDQGAKDRSATASRIRAQGSNTRIADMGRRVKESDTNVARHEAIMVRSWFEGPDEAKEFVAPFVAPEDIGLWLVGIRFPDDWISIYGIEEMPIRDRRTKEERKRGREEISMELLGAVHSAYYTTVEEAAQATMAALQAIEQLAMSHREEFVLLSMFWDNTGGNGFSAEAMFPQQDPNDPNRQEPPGFPEGVGPRQVTVEDVWRDTSGITAKELVRELGYEIHSTSGTEYTKEAEAEMANTMIGQGMGPAMNALQQGNPEPINALFRRYDDANNVPDDKRMPEFTAPPPPPGPGGPAQGAPQ